MTDGPIPMDDDSSPSLDLAPILRTELAQFDGREGHRAYIAYFGLVYDVSNSSLWRGGGHQALHLAGRDLTAELRSAPHGASLLARVPVVGRLTGPGPLPRGLPPRC